MRLAVKQKLIDDINEAFITIASKNKSKAYAKYLNEINRKMLKDVENLDAAKVKSIVNGAKLNIDDTALLFMILSAITLIVNNQRMTVKEKTPLLPILAIIGIYSITRPKILVDKIYKANKGIGLNSNEKKVKQLLDVYKKDNKATFNKTKRATIKQLEVSTRKATTKVGRNMLKDLKVLREENVSIKSMERTLEKKYKVTDVERTLNTELHSQAELTKTVHAQANGFTHKKWITQKDSRVRHTRFHDGVANKSVPIESDFRAGGLRADHPGDTKLPPSDRIRCRCYLIYEKH